MRARGWGSSTSSRSSRSSWRGSRCSAAWRTRTSSREGQGSALLLLLLPGLIAVAAAIVVARMFPAAARWWADRSRGGVAARLAAVGLARGPGAAVATVAFLTIAFALALLAEGYRATLSRADREQAAFQVPLDVVVRENLQNLVRVFEAAPLQRFAQVAGEEAVRASGPPRKRERRARRARERRDRTGPGRRLDPRHRRVATRLGRPGRAPTSSPRSSIPATTSLSEASRSPAIASFSESLRASSRTRRSCVSTTAPSVASCSVTPTRSAAQTLRAQVPPGAQLVRLQVVPPRRLIERGADAGNGFIETVRLSGPLAMHLRDWQGEGGVVSSADLRRARSARVADLCSATRSSARTRRPTTRRRRCS